MFVKRNPALGCLGRILMNKHVLDSIMLHKNVPSNGGERKEAAEEAA